MYGSYWSQTLLERKLEGNIINLSEITAHWRPHTAVFSWSRLSSKIMLSETDLGNSDLHWVDKMWCNFTSFWSSVIIFSVLKSWGPGTFKNDTFSCTKYKCQKLSCRIQKTLDFYKIPRSSTESLSEKYERIFVYIFLRVKVSEMNVSDHDLSEFWKIFPGCWDTLLWISKNPWFSTIFKDLKIVDLQAVPTLSATPSYKVKHFF